MRTCSRLKESVWSDRERNDTMANVYSRLTKINNAKGRSQYISDPKRQEEILLHKSDLEYGWSVIEDFEKLKSNVDKENWQARELVVALPNDLSNDEIKLEKVCDELTQNLIGNNREHEYAVHWNKGKTNLHVHILFSERERVQELKPKIYKRDMWYDKDTNKMAKAKAENAELRFQKGEIMKDKSGNVRYDSDPFSAKDTKFKSRAFLLEKQYTIQEVLNQNGYDFDVQNNSTPYLSQKKLFKGASPEYLDIAKQYNEEVQQYNQAVKEHLAIEPEQKEVYQEMRSVLEKDIKNENRQSQSFSIKAIEVVRDIKDYVVDLVSSLKKSITDVIDRAQLGDWWDSNKDELMELMDDSESLENEKERMANFVHSVDEVIEDQEKTIEEIEYTKGRNRNYGPTL